MEEGEWLKVKRWNRTQYVCTDSSVVWPCDWVKLVGRFGFRKKWKGDASNKKLNQEKAKCHWKFKVFKFQVSIKQSYSARKVVQRRQHKEIACSSSNQVDTCWRVDVPHKCIIGETGSKDRMLYPRASKAKRISLSRPRSVRGFERVRSKQLFELSARAFCFTYLILQLVRTSTYLGIKSKDFFRIRVCALSMVSSGSWKISEQARYLSNNCHSTITRKIIATRVWKEQNDLCRRHRRIEATWARWLPKTRGRPNTKPRLAVDVAVRCFYLSGVN